MVSRIMNSVAVVTLLLTGSALAQQDKKPDPLRVLSSKVLQDDLNLSRTQLERVRQLMLQWEGPAALRRDEIAREIGLRKSQRAAIKRVFQAHSKLEFEYFRLRKTNRGRAKGFAKDVKASARMLPGRVLDVLSDTQRARFEKLLGKPLDRSKLFEPKRRRPDV